VHTVTTFQGNPRLRAWARALPAALLLLFFLRGFLAMQADGTTVDEPTHLAYGQRALASGTFLRPDALLNSKMPVSVLNALPVMIASRGRALSWHQQLFLARLPSLLLGVLLGWLVWHWALALFGFWGGIVSLLLYTLCPNLIAHAHLVTTDIATALAMFAATYCLWRYSREPSIGRLLAAAGAFGLAQLTKATALFLLPIFVLILAARGLADLRRNKERGPPQPAEGARSLGETTRRGALVLAACGVATILALNLGFWFEGTGTPLGRYTFVSPSFEALRGVPVLRSLPLPLPYAYLQGLDMVSRDSRAGNYSYLRGRYSDSGFRAYYLWAFLVKVPLATQIVLALALFLWAAGWVRAPTAEPYLLIPVVVLLLLLSFVVQLDIGFRYFLPALPYLFVFAGRVAAPGPIARAAHPARWALLGGGLLLWLVASSCSAHPHYLAYFNEIAGGPLGGSRWLLDSNLDWGQDDETVKRLYPPGGNPPVLFDPSGPVAGRIAINVSNLVGGNPDAARLHAWLRDNFQPTRIIGYTWRVFDVTEADLGRCCAGMPRALTIEDLPHDLAISGEPFAGGDGVSVRFLNRLNDGMVGANEPIDAVRTLPPQRRSVRGWFGIRWSTPQAIGRVLAFPSFASRGPLAGQFLAVDYVFQSWNGAQWIDIPGTRVTANQALRVEHRFPTIVTDQIRLLVERERNERGTEAPTGAFRAACLELAAYQK
jgi:Dolichyl-phosphate-mannose-protein mannosyltransferase